MTINDAKVALFHYFADNETFDLEHDFNDVVLVSLDEQIDKEIISLALKEFENQNLIAKLNVADKKVWVLVKSLKQYSQTVEIHFPTIEAIVSLLTSYCQETGNMGEAPDPFQVTEKDVQNLLVITHALKNQENDA